MSNTTYLFRKQNTLSSTEFFQILITSVFAGFFISFDDWGVEALDYVFGVTNLLFSIFSVLIILCAIVLLQKLLGSYYGYKITYHWSWIGLVLGFLVTFLSYGAIPFFLVGGISYDVIRTARIGKYLPSYKHAELTTIVLIAAIIPLIFSLVFGSFYVLTESLLFKNITIAALLIAIYALLPFPQVSSLKKLPRGGIVKRLEGGTYGFDLLVFSTTTYSFTLAFVIVFCLLVLLFQIFSLLVSAALAVIALFIYKKGLTYLKG